MRLNTDMEKEMTNAAIDNFSNNYVEQIVAEGKNNYSIEDIRNAYIQGAKWMKDFLDVKNMLMPKL